MNSKFFQEKFLKFLERDGSDALLRFWIDVEKLKKFNLTNIKKKYELAHSIYDNYLKKYDSPVRDEIGKDSYKLMQLFLLGNNVNILGYFLTERGSKVELNLLISFRHPNVIFEVY